MSGIAGVICRDGSAAGSVDGMAAAMPHRGSSLHTWTDGTAQLASLGIRPRTSASASSPATAVVLAGHIHHATEFGNTLRPPPAPSDPAWRNDAAFVLAAYEEWGDRCMEHIDGELACAIWDRREQRLLLARDRFGSRPLVYAAVGDRIFFATDTRAIRAVAATPFVPDALRIAQYLGDSMGDRTRTFYEGIRRVPDASVVTFDMNGRRTRRYWAPPRGIPTAHAAQSSDRADVAADVVRFRALFMAAVRERMPDDAVVGVLLSGGLDSSSVACAAVEERARADAPAPVAISGVFETLPSCDESAWIRQLEQATAIRSVLVPLDAASPTTHMADVIRCHDEPPWVPNLFMFWDGVLPAARAAGVTVLLDGTDGDTVVSHGQGVIHELASARRFRDLWRTAHQGGAPRGRTIRRIFDEGVRPLVPPALRRLYRRMRGSSGLPPGLLSDELARLANATDMLDLEEGNPSLPTVADGRSATVDSDLHWYSVTSGVNSYLAEVLERSAAWHGLELQHPFYDDRLVEHCVGLPADRKLRDGLGRWILREAMRSELPDRIRTRRDKTQLGPAFERAVRRDLPAIEQSIGRNRERLAPYVDLAILDAALHRCRHTPRRFDALAVWKVALLGEWLDHTMTDTPDRGQHG